MTRTIQVEARERILRAADDLFARRGIQNVGVDELITRASVAKATFYRHFPSKDALGLAFLERRETRWNYGLITADAMLLSSTPQEQLHAIFDVLDDWFLQVDFEGCSFTKVLLEMGPEHPLGQASIRLLGNIRTTLEQLAAGAGLREPEEFAYSLQILIGGAIIAAHSGDLESARRAKRMAIQLISDHQ